MKNTYPKTIGNLHNEYKIFVDTSSLMHQSAKNFFTGYLNNVLKKMNTRLILPYKAIEELRDLEHSTDEQSKKNSKKALKLIKEYQKEQLIDVAGEKDDPTLYELFKKIFVELSGRYDLCLITQNTHLVKDILSQREALDPENKNKQFVAFKIKKPNEEQLFKVFTHKKSTKNKKSKNKNISKFKIYSQPINLNSATILNVKPIPKQGDYILNNERKELLLEKEIGKGGEGSVYLTNTGQVCKIYKKEKLSNIKKEKIELMLSNKIEYDGICWPVANAYNIKGQFIGYLMNKAEGRELQRSIFIKPLLIKYFPHWTKRHLLELILTILDKIKYLHDRNVIIGDINPLNIIVESETEVYFVDTDSYQIEEYPCPVGTVNYTPPELQGRDYKSFLRTIENEYFAVATLMFMILFPGKPPYSRRGGSDPATNIKNTNFSYPYGQYRKKKTPEGSWRFIWSHLPRYIKNSFFDIFENNNRKTTDEWIKLIKRYKRDLDKRENLSEEIFPKKLKPRKSRKTSTGKPKDKIKPKKNITKDKNNQTDKKQKIDKTNKNNQTDKKQKIDKTNKNKQTDKKQKTKSSGESIFDILMKILGKR